MFTFYYILLFFRVPTKVINFVISLVKHGFLFIFNQDFTFKKHSMAKKISGC